MFAEPSASAETNTAEGTTRRAAQTWKESGGNAATARSMKTLLRNCAAQHAGRGSEPTGPIQQPSSGGAWVRNLRFGGVIPHHCPSFSTPGSEPYSRAPARIQQVVFIL